MEVVPAVLVAIIMAVTVDITRVTTRVVEAVVAAMEEMVMTAMAMVSVFYLPLSKTAQDVVVF